MEEIYLKRIPLEKGKPKKSGDYLVETVSKSTPMAGVLPTKRSFTAFFNGVDFLVSSHVEVLAWFKEIIVDRLNLRRWEFLNREIIEHKASTVNLQTSEEILTFTFKDGRVLELTLPL